MGLPVMRIKRGPRGHLRIPLSSLEHLLGTSPQSLARASTVAAKPPSETQWISELLRAKGKVKRLRAALAEALEELRRLEGDGGKSEGENL